MPEPTALMLPDTKGPPLPLWIPRGGNLKEFVEAARQAVEKAAWCMNQPMIAGMPKHIPDGFPLTNIYLNRGMQFMGVTPALATPRKAWRRRKRIFSMYNDIWWGVTINRQRNRAVAEHRSGYRARFAKAA